MNDDHRVYFLIPACVGSFVVRPIPLLLQNCAVLCVRLRALTCSGRHLFCILLKAAIRSSSSVEAFSIDYTNLEFENLCSSCGRNQALEHCKNKKRMCSSCCTLYTFVYHVPLNSIYADLRSAYSRMEDLPLRMFSKLSTKCRSEWRTCHDNEVTVLSSNL